MFDTGNWSNSDPDTVPAQAFVVAAFPIRRANGSFLIGVLRVRVAANPENSGQYFVPIETAMHPAEPLSPPRAIRAELVLTFSAFLKAAAWWKRMSGGTAHWLGMTEAPTLSKTSLLRTRSAAAEAISFGLFAEDRG